MRVTRLKMQSFRGIGNLTLDFSDTGATVFLGINGVGKSSILDCIAILLSWLKSHIQYDPEARGSYVKMGNGFSSISGKLKVLANGEFFSERDIRNGTNETSNEINILDDNKPIKWSLKLLQKGTYFNPDENIDELKEFAKNIRDKLQNNLELNIPIFVYYPVNRAVIDVSLNIIEKKSFNQTEAYDQALTGAGADFGRFFQWFRTLEDIENEERRDNTEYRNRHLEAVRQAISSLLPEFSNLRVRRSPLRMTLEKQGEELIINQLSDGEKCLLAMVGDLARRLAIANPSLAKPLQGEGIVLIDEIELHLHPKWQREIIPALTYTFPNCQFIVTTHSPQVVSHVQPEGIFLLEKTENGVIAKRPESSFGRDSNRILEDLMHVPARPQEIKDSLHQLFRLIDEGNLEGAKQLRQQIADTIGDDEPELAKASVSIRRKEILKR